MSSLRWLAALLLFGCPASEPGHIYDTPFGAVYCGSHGVNELSGLITLSDCADGSIYHVHNVRQREAE